MLDFKLTHIGAYACPQKYLQRVASVFIFFPLRGLERVRFAFGQWEKPAPFIGVLLPGETFYFEFAASRLNWVITLSSECFKPGLEASRWTLVWGGREISLPRLTFFPNVAETEDLGRRFREIQELSQQPTAANAARVEARTVAVLGYLLDRDNAGPPITPAGKLKALLDDRRELNSPLAELCARCGYSTDYLRALFRAEFEISPGEYRLKRKTRLCMDLIASSPLSLKEIAAEMGFRHFSHFSALFKKTYGITAAEAVHRYRHHNVFGKPVPFDKAAP